MGEAIFAGYKFRLDPESVSWGYKAKAQDTPTMGGKVVQVFGTEITDMTLEGSFGVGGWRQQERFLARMKEIGTQQAADYLVSNSTKPPFKFIYPPKGWDFMCYLKAYENPSGGRSVTLDPFIVNPRWRLVLFIVEDNSDLKTISQNAYIARLSKGLGWRQSEYNGGYGLTDSTSAIMDAIALGGGGGSGSSAGEGGYYDLSPNVQRWRPLVAKYFPSQFVNQALSVMQCESGGDPNAVNPQNVGAKLGGQAKGLFQHMDGFWAERSRAAGFAGASIFDPEANIATAAWLFKQTNDWRHWVCKPKVSATPVSTSIQFSGTPEQRKQVETVLEWYDDALSANFGAISVEWVKEGDLKEGLNGTYNHNQRKIKLVNGVGLSTIAHEFGHAYDFNYFKDEQREAFRRHLGLKTWLGTNYRWDQRAGEKAADLLAWYVNPNSKHNGVFTEWAGILGLSR